MKKVLLFLFILTSFLAKGQTVTPQWQPLPNGIKFFYPGKIPSGYDSLYSFKYLKTYFSSSANSAYTVNTITDLQNYSGLATTVIVIDSLRGGIFNYYPSATAYNNGTTFQAVGKGVGIWDRNTVGITGVYPEWWGAKPFDPFTENNTTGYDSRTAIQAAIDYYPNRAGQVNIARQFLLKDTLVLGQNTKLVGTVRLFPYQVAFTPPYDTIKYVNPSALWFLNNTNGLVTTLEAVNYRNQGIVIENLGIYGTGKANGKTGILLRDNPNATTQLKSTGLARLKDIFVSGFGTLADGRNSADSWYVTGSHFNDGMYGLRGGTSGMYSIMSDYYDILISCLESNGKQDIINLNEIESDSVSLGIAVKGTGAVISGNQFLRVKNGVRIYEGALGNRLDANSFDNVTSDYIVVDSNARNNSITNNTFYRRSTSLFIDSNATFIRANYARLTDITGNRFIKDDVLAYMGPSMVLTNNIQITVEDNNYSGFSDNSVASATLTNNTYVTKTEVGDKWLKGKRSFGNKFDNFSEITLSGDNSTSDQTMSIVSYNTTAANGSTLEFRRALGAGASPLVITDGTTIGSIDYKGYNGSAWTGARAYMRVDALNNWSGSNNGTKINFGTTANGSVGGASPRMNLTATGLYSGGTTTATAWFDATGSTNQAPLRLRTGSSPTSPNDGDIWNNSGVLRFRYTSTYRIPRQTDVAGTNTQIPQYNSTGELVPTDLSTVMSAYSTKTGTETLTNKTLTLPKLTGYTVATLPAAGTVGRMAYVTDALAPSFLVTVVGGGTVITPVFDNGTNWVAY